MKPEFHLFLPQIRLTPNQIVARAVVAEAAGFDGIALMDHLVPPAAEDQPMYEAMTMATWLAARTHRLTISHLVLCDALRSPAVLARQAVTLDHLSSGRFELAIGSGSTPAELSMFGMGGVNLEQRTARLGETLDVLKGLWSGHPFTFAGEFHRIDGAIQQPVPTRPIPIVIGGTGPATMALVARHADWWNVPLHHAERLEGRRNQAGSARVSLQQMVTFIRHDQAPHEVLEAAERRFGWMGTSGRAQGGGSELVEHFGSLHAAGIDRFYTWFSDFGDPRTLEAFGTEVIGAMH